MTATGLMKASVLGVSMIALASSAAWAATTTTTTTATTAAPPAKAPVKAKPKRTVYETNVPPNTVEPGAVAAMLKMSNYLRSLSGFGVQMATERDEVDEYGQVLTFEGTTTYKVKKPDAFTVDRDEDMTDRQYVYDGKSVTVYDPKTKYYAQFAAPSTISGTLKLANDTYGVSVPLDDLFHWDENGDLAKKLTAAHFVGPTEVAGHPANHYAFRQPGVDWQIWISQGDNPVPVRIVIVANDDPARPQFEANLTWDLAPTFAADTFVFTPPADSKKIPIQTDAR
jgi:hypothetical protein